MERPNILLVRYSERRSSRHWEAKCQLMKILFAGTNAWWLGHLWDDADVETTFTEIVDSQLKIVRVWGFGNSNTNSSTQTYYQLINETLPGLKTAINYGSNGQFCLSAEISLLSSIRPASRDSQRFSYNILTPPRFSISTIPTLKHTNTLS